MEKIIFNSSIHSPYDIYSNFTPSPIMVEGIQFPTVEHAFQAYKTMDLDERRAIASLPTPGKAARVGRKLDLRPDWEEVKYDLMVVCLRKKFATEPFKSSLLMTGDAEIAEDASQWNDAIWGLGRSGKGKNMLGLALMQVREELRCGTTEKN